MRKITTLLLTLLLLFSLNITVNAQEVTIRTSVPDRHTLTVNAQHADVFYQEKAGTEFEIERLSEPTLLIRPDDGYKVSKVTLNGEDITDKIIGGYYTLEPVFEEKMLVVETVDVTTDSDSTHNISGTVTDEDGNPISGATVDIGGKTDVTDKDEKFTVKDVPDGYHPVTITDKEGNVIGYTELEISEGNLNVIKNPNGTYTITAPKNSAIYMELTVKENGRTDIGGVKDVTTTHSEDANNSQLGKPNNSQIKDPNSPQTGDNSNMHLWFSLMVASTGVLFFVIFMNRRRKYDDIK